MNEHRTDVKIPDRTTFADVRRAIDRFRRGDPVIVAADGLELLCYAAETLDEAGLVAARGAAKSGLGVAMTGLRATALGLETISADLSVLDFSNDVALARILDVADPAARLGAAAVPGNPRESAGRERKVFAAALALAKLAGLIPAVLACEMARRPQDVPTVTSDNALRFAEDSARWLTRVAEAQVPLAGAGPARIIAYRPYEGGAETLAIVIGAPDVRRAVLTRIHSACFTGDLLASLRCDCGDQLRGAIEAMAREGSGVIVYLPQEGRGIGLVNKLRAYALQDRGFDTIDANLHLGFAPDERSYAAAGEILRQLGITRIRLLTNNPEKIDALAKLGCDVVERVAHVFAANPYNAGYLRTKALRAGHNF